MNTTTEVPVIAMTIPAPIQTPIQANNFYAIIDDTNNTCSYAVVKVIKTTAHRLKICQFSQVFKGLPDLIYAEELGDITAQFWLDIHDFLAWQPMGLSVIEAYPSIDDDIDWVA